MTDSPICVEQPGPKWHYLLVAALAGVMVFWHLGQTALDEHEAKLALAAGAMAQSDPQPWIVPGGQAYTVPPHTAFNHWVVPVENGWPRLVKTPLPYWLAGGTGRACMAWFGSAEPMNEFIARFYSAVASIVLACVTLAMGRRMFSPRAALLGAVMFATCLGLQKWGRNARPEILLLTFITIAMYCFYVGLESPTRRSRAAWMIAFWVAMGLANLAKELVPMLLAWPLLAYLTWRQGNQQDQAVSGRRLAWFLGASMGGLAAYLIVISCVSIRSQVLSYSVMALCLGLPMLWYFVVNRGWRQVVPLLPTAIPGIVLMLAAFVPWMLYMSALFPHLAGETFSHQTSERVAGTGGFGIAEPQKYIASLLTLTAPWCIFLPGAFAAGLMRRFSRHHRALVFLLLWTVGIIMLFCAVAGKRDHYILPMLSAVCLLMGFTADDVFFNHAWISKPLGRVIALGHAAAGVLAVVVFGLFYAYSAQHSGQAGQIAVHSLKGIKNAVIEHAVMWPYMLAISAVAAVPLIVAGVAAWRGRLRATVGLVAAAVGIFYFGQWTFGDKWDDRAPLAHFAQRAAVTTAGQDVYHWDWPQSAMAFYFGRYLPMAQDEVARPRAARVGSDATGSWQQWLADRRNAPWIIGDASAAKTLAPYGYVPVYAGRGSPGDVPILFHRPSQP